MAKRPGIYRITNTKNGKVYVGSSEHAPRRMYIHKWKLRRGMHDNVFLQRAWDADGEAAFSFEIVEDVPDHSLILAREQAWIDRYDAAKDANGYNLCSVAGTRRGVPQPPTVAEKMSSFHRGKPKSAETRAKMSAAAKGRRNTPEQNEKIRQAVKRRFEDPAERAKAAEYGAMAEPYWKGKKLPEHVVEQLRQARLREPPREREADGTFQKRGDGSAK